MISEIYACGRNGVSAFMVVEQGVVVHYGSYQWNGVIDFEGIQGPADDLNCEILAVVCGMMLCQNDGRKLVNIYTGNYNTHERYNLGMCDSPFIACVKRHREGMNLHSDKWPEEFLEQGQWVKNQFISQCEDMVNKD